jgi:hypothetical protein
MCEDSDCVTRIKSLERQLRDAHERWSDKYNQAYYLELQLKAADTGNLEQALEFRTAYLQGKIDRQRRAIDRIQRKGWQPSFIIEEEAYF